MKIAIIGTGYIGLVSGVCLAHIGHHVICVDSDLQKIDQLRKGIVPIFERDLEQLLQTVVASHHLTFATDVEDATRQSECVMIAVGTPTAADGSSSDLTNLHDAVREVAAGINGYKTIVVKSTVPVGTGAMLKLAIQQANSEADFEMASNPEFLKEGVAIADFMTPDRIVIGTDGQRAKAAMQEMYQYFSDRHFTILNTDIESAELIKFASNAFLATKIAFINEMAELCEATGAKVADVAKAMGLDDRIGPKFLQSGPGFGGSCFPKDIRALSAFARQRQMELRIVDALIDSNKHTMLRMVDKIMDLAGGSLQGLRLTVFGVTFKPETDDMREAPSLTIVPALQAQGAEIRVVDPEGQRHGQALLPNVEWHVDPVQAVKNSDMIVVLTEWRMFKNLDLATLAQSMRRAAMADLRNIYSVENLRKAGFVDFCHVGSTYT